MSATLDRAIRTVRTRRDPRTPPRREARQMRRLERLAHAASAVSVAPVGYATRPVTADALVHRSCSTCPPGSRCCGSYTAFCCTLPGGNNFGCPPNTFVGGWWQCNYGKAALCGTTNMRYYLDCSMNPGAACPGGCHCGNQSCANFKTCCVVFRYGNCNTHIPHVTPIQCRLVTCVIPCRIGCLDCNCSVAVDQHTCLHEAGCL
ncbi:MAG: hypothetical protein E6G58_10325 [Actinobacteria bacterium]|nr:MAG: hypothetical protein E6G58_10325 [Actinomycetota bacterium]